jgi:hypothetical protein
MESREQSTNIGAATDGLRSSGWDFRAFACLQPLPHALG